MKQLFQSRNNPVCLLHAQGSTELTPVVPCFNPAIIRSAFYTWTMKEPPISTNCFNPAIIRSAFYTELSKYVRALSITCFNPAIIRSAFYTHFERYRETHREKLVSIPQ